MKFLLFFIITSLSCELKFGEAVAPQLGFKRKVEIIKVDCKFQENGLFSLYFTLRKFNRTHSSISANCTLKDIMDGRYRFKLEVQIWGDGGWKRNFVNYDNNNPCEQLKLMFGTPWKYVLKYANISENCPFQPGYYEVTDMYLDLTAIPLIFTTGHFKAIIDVFKGTLWIVTVVIEVIISDYSKFDS